MTERRRPTVRDLRRTNRSALLSELCRSAPLTRSDLGAATGLSQATVSNLVAGFIAEGLVVETGSVDSDGGRPSSLLRLNPTYRYLIGVDVGETRVRVELFDLALTRLAKADHPMVPGDHDIGRIVADIAEGIRAVVGQAGVPPGAVAGVGVAVPGVVLADSGTPGSGVVVDAQAFGWDRVPVEQLLRRYTELPLHIDNGAKCMGHAEMWFGAGRGLRYAVIALIGSGVGASVVIDGRTYRGVSSAGEWGHTTIVAGGRTCRCGARGCLEAYVGAEAILARYRQAAGRPPGGDEEAELAALLRAAGRSRTADRVLADTAGYLGAGIGGLVNLFSPQAVILGGWAGIALGRRLLPAIRTAAAAHSLRAPFAGTRIELCELGPDAVALGAAILPLERLLNPGTASRLQPYGRRVPATAG
ncbi:MAG: sugar kinase [Actinobacteria bacterium 13_1_20CM_3_71_11]|nr:MAG: sugar kinase [Actinobacteria bacterium 13_1_20CM_3_71_11]